MVQSSHHTKPQNINTVRPPIVVVMGHIDHGKTALLDFYRKTKLVEEEAGGITQHIGAYEVEHQGKKITFIDTPGHEAFFKIRSRGAKAADIAVLVVAADEGVKPQTKETIEIIQKHSLPFVAAINKIDKSGANPERVKSQLAEAGVLVESYGGKVPAVEVSAKTGANMDKLLETILLLAELEELKFDQSRPAQGVVIEAHLDSQRGITASLILLDGTLKKEYVLAIGKNVETIKILEDFLARPVQKASSSSPLRIAGLQNMPAVGDTFLAFKTRGEAEKYAASLTFKKEEVKTKPALEAAGKPIFNIILKTDVLGSKEALEDSLKKLESNAIGINILKSEIGDINESDVKLALSTKLVTIVGFKVKTDPAVRQLAESANIHILTGDVIYDLIDAVKYEASEIIPPEVKRKDLGIAKILKVFKKDGNKQIVGGRVEEGFIKKNVKAEIKRARENAGQGMIIQLQQNRQDVNEVTKGFEFGVMIDAPVAIEEGDVLEVFEEEIIKIGL